MSTSGECLFASSEQPKSSAWARVASYIPVLPVKKGLDSYCGQEKIAPGTKGKLLLRCVHGND
ncbi:hypothetical protein BDR04DRAFT_1110459 [Suillus decipiens]|nr:hypothetical protein BDR04DRAFT_1110459 [Suillus decipiens]